MGSLRLKSHMPCRSTGTSICKPFHTKCFAQQILKIYTKCSLSISASFFRSVLVPAS